MNNSLKIITSIAAIILILAIFGVFYAAAAGVTWLICSAFGVMFNWAYPIAGYGAAFVAAIIMEGVKQVWKKI